MKILNNPYPFLAALLMVFSATGGHSEDTPQSALLNYGGENLSAPPLDEGRHEGAALFTAAQTKALTGGKLVEVQYYIKDLPAACEVRVYSAGSAAAPGALLYTADVTASTTGNSWNTHRLQTPVAITGDALWISIGFANGKNQRTLGCDPGPAVQNGDWLFSAADNSWKPLVERVPTISINWNIRGGVSLLNSETPSVMEILSWGRIKAGVHEE